MSSYSLPASGYQYDALEPHLSGEIVELHHAKHHAAYVKGANDTLERVAQGILEPRRLGRRCQAFRQGAAHGSRPLTAAPRIHPEKAIMPNEHVEDSSKRPIAKVFRENRCDPLDEETLQLQSEPAKVRFRVHKHHGWSDDQKQKEI